MDEIVNKYLNEKKDIDKDVKALQGWLNDMLSFYKNGNFKDAKNVLNNIVKMLQNDIKKNFK